MTSLPLHPALQADAPRSGTQHRVRHFSIEALPSNYPYDISSIQNTQSVGTKVPYIETRSVGPPFSTALATAGDVYFDMTLDNHQVWLRDVVSWRRWLGPSNEHGDTLQLHPEMTMDRRNARYFGTSGRAFCWYSESTLRKAKERIADDFESGEEEGPSLVHRLIASCFAAESGDKTAAQKQRVKIKRVHDEVDEEDTGDSTSSPVAKAPRRSRNSQRASTAASTSTSISPSISTSIAFHSHLSISSNSSNLQCYWDACCDTFNVEKQHYLHLRNHIGTRAQNNVILTCKWKDCDKTCKARENMIEHMRSHTPYKEFKCTKCSSQFKHYSNFNSHRKNVHGWKAGHGNASSASSSSEIQDEEDDRMIPEPQIVVHGSQDVQSPRYTMSMEEAVHLIKLNSMVVKNESTCVGAS